jgi:hypothetical protein
MDFEEMELIAIILMCVITFGAIYLMVTYL